MGVSVDPVDSHYRWMSRLERVAGTRVTFPIAEDPNRWIGGLYGMVDPASERHLMVRSVFVIDPDDRVRLMLAYPACTGRNFTELLRVIDALQLADTEEVATPEGWQPGDDTVSPPS